MTRNNWDGGIQVQDQANTEGYTELMKWNEPFPMPQFPIMSAKESYDFVLQHAGATLPKRDIVDERVIEEVKTGKNYYVKGLNPDEFYQFEYRRLPKDSYTKGIITDIKQVGGYPEYKGKPYVDTDKDGMPDKWEKANGLNPKDPSDALKDITGDGYTNIEKYINGISTKEKVDWTNPANNQDTLKGRKSLM